MAVYCKVTILESTSLSVTCTLGTDPLKSSSNRVDLCKKSGILLHGRFISPLLFINLLSHSFVAAATHRYFILWVITQYHLILCPGFGRFSLETLPLMPTPLCQIPHQGWGKLSFVSTSTVWPMCISFFNFTFFTSGTAFSLVVSVYFVPSLPFYGNVLHRFLLLAFTCLSRFELNFFFNAGNTNFPEYFLESMTL